MPSYDPQTDTIHGCRKYSMAWYHERGHQIFEKSERMQSIKTWESYMLWGTLACLIMNNRILAGICFLIFLCLMSEEEIAAWAYAFKNKNRWQ